MQGQVGNLEDILKELDQLQKQARVLEETAAKERDQLQQQVRHLQDAANERDRLHEDLVDITEERDSLQDRAVELERLLQVASGPNEGTKPEGLGPESEVDKQPSRLEPPKKLRYCNVCLNSVNKLGANVRLDSHQLDVSANFCYRQKSSMPTNARPAYRNFYS